VQEAQIGIPCGTVPRQAGRLSLIVLRSDAAGSRAVPRTVPLRRASSSSRALCGCWAVFRWISQAVSVPT